LNIGPRFLVVPAALEKTAEQLLAPIYAADVDEVNPFAGALVPVVESRLDATDLSWFVAADPARMPSIAYVQREGAESPRLRHSTISQPRAWPSPWSTTSGSPLWTGAASPRFRRAADRDCRALSSFAAWR